MRRLPRRPPPLSRILSGRWSLNSPIGTPPSRPPRTLGDKLQVIAGRAPRYLHLFDLLADEILRRLEP